MKQRILTGLIFTIMIAAFVIPGYWTMWPPVILLAAVAVIASCEISSAMRHCCRKPNLTLVIIGSLFCLLPLATRLIWSPDATLFSAVASFALALFCLLVFMAASIIARLLIDGPSSFPDALATNGAMLYVSFPLTCAILLLTHIDGGWLWLVIGLSAPWVSDVFAYFTGSLFGRHLIVPSLSPKKTVEGCFGGIAGSMLSQMLIFHLFRDMLGGSVNRPSIYLTFAILSGLLLSIASQLGDWLASGFKRYCGIKDFGDVLPGHGGLMDRFDSAFFTLPITLILAILYQVII
ncbi:MAG: phosphatidate cytidylyltransferase [Bacillota bacterium]|nr:phosphatidate cytidylyltransferase [Bacillota bacterium]